MLALLSQQGGVHTERELAFLNMPELWVVGLVIAPLVVAFAWWSYGGISRLETRPRILLSILRGGTILFCLLVLAQPAYEIKHFTKIQTQVHVLVDDSASMQRKDTYPDPKQRQSLSLASGVGDLTGMSRSALVAKVLERPGGLFEKLRQNHDLRLFRFVRKPLPIQDLGELSAKGERTPLGDALDLHLSAAGGASLEAVILVSDGRNNAGLAPDEVAIKYRNADLAIYTIGVGDPHPPCNVRIIGPPGPKEALRLEEVVFDVNVVAEGMHRRNVTVSLEASHEGGAFLPVTSPKPISLGPDGEPQRVQMVAAFETAGDYELRFKVSSVPEETSLEDNVDTRFLRVIDEKIRVLFLDDVPRWEYRYVKWGLKRVDPSIEMQSFLFDASGDFSQEHSEQLPPLYDLPRSRKDMQKYHVILIGDVPPEKLGATEQAVNRWLELLVEFVEFGGGLGLMYGEQAMPERYRGTALADLLPVVLEDPLEVRDIEQRLDRTEPFRPQLENRTIPHDIVMLSRNPEDNLRLWERDLEGLLVYYPVQQAKAGAEVILRHPSDENRFGKRVLAAAGTYPRGRTFFMATDETWRWRMGYGERYHDTFWRNVVRYLAAGRLRRRDDRVELRLNKLVAETGEQVKISLLKHDEELQPSTEPEATVFLRRAGGQPERRSLRAQQGEPGAYLGSFSMDRPASLSVLVYEDDNPSGKVLAREDVIIKIPDRELTHSSQDAETLQKIAQASKGGRYVFLGQALEILEEFRGRRAPETEVHRQIETLWDRSWVLFVVLGLLAVEWIIRKRVRLV